MLKQYRVSLAIALAAMVNSPMTAIAQPPAESEAPPQPDQAASDDNPSQGSAESVRASASIESNPQAEYSRSDVSLAQVDSSEPKSVPVSHATPPLEPVQSAAVVVPAEPIYTTADKLTTPPEPMPTAAVVPSPAAKLAPIPAIAPSRTVEFSQTPLPVPASVTAAAPAISQAPLPIAVAAPAAPANPVLISATQTQVQVEQTRPPGNTERIEQPVPPQSVQDQLLQLQQQQQQLQQQIKALQQQVTVAPKGSAVVVDNKNPQGLTVSGEALFWKPRTSDSMDYAIADPGTALATSGDLKTVELDSATGGRVGLNYRFPNSGWDLGGKYTFLDTQGSDSAIAPTNGFLFSTLSHPFQNETADTANANAKFGYKAGDLEAGYNLKAGKVDVRLFGGLRASNLERNTTVDYNGRDYTNGQVQLENRFKGIGPRIGAEATVLLGAGFNLFGKGAVSLQTGTLTSSFQETDRNGADVIADVSRKQGGHVVPGVELAVGLGWEKSFSKNAKVSLSGGYEVQQLFNTTDSVRFVDAASPGVFSQSNGDASLKGFFVKGVVSLQF